MRVDFETMPFRFLPAHIRWAYAKFANEDFAGRKDYDEREALFRTVDDVDADDVGIFWYGALLSDGRWVVDESHELVLEAIEKLMEDGS